MTVHPVHQGSDPDKEKNLYFITYNTVYNVETEVWNLFSALIPVGS